MTVGQVRRRFERFNRLYWAGALTVPRIIIVPSGQKGLGISGCGDWGGFMLDDGEPRFELAMAFVNDSLLNITLLHEMVHQRLGVNERHRGRKWNREVRRISKLGALIEVL